MPTVSMAYDNPNYTQIRQENKTKHPITAVGVQHELTWRSHVAAVVTGIFVVLASAATGSLILTLLMNGSVAAILTLCNTANTAVRTFTLTVNRTLAAMTDRIEIATPTHNTGALSVVYEYRIVPGSTYSLFGTLG